MGCHILEGKDGEGAILYCSTTDWAFGPKMESLEEAEDFIRFLPADPRTYSAPTLQSLYTEFVTENKCECGALRESECSECTRGIPLFDGFYVDNYGINDGRRRKGPHHVDDEDSKRKLISKCDIEPKPAAGERFQCSRCKAKKVDEKRREAGCT